MNLIFGSGNLERLAEDEDFSLGLPPEVEDIYRHTVRLLAAFPREADFRSMSVLNYSALPPPNETQRSIELISGWRLLGRIMKVGRKDALVLIRIERQD